MFANIVTHQLGLLAQQHHADIVQGVSLLLGWLASYLTAFLTHENAPPRLKAAITTLLSVAGGVVATVVWSNGEPWWLWVKAVGLALIANQMVHRLGVVTGVAFLQKIGLGLGNPENANPTDPAVFPGAVDNAPISSASPPVG